jgi:hypothetical protein
MAERKAFLLRLDPAVWTELERLAQQELRSINAQIEFLLRDGPREARHRASARPTRTRPAAVSDTMR